MERQLQQARENLAAWTKKLDERGVAAGDRRRDAVWRNLNARCRQLTARLRVTGEVARVNEDLKQRKAEKAAAPKTEKTKAGKSKKEGKSKKDKQAPKAEKKGDKKGGKKPKKQKQK